MTEIIEIKLVGNSMFPSLKHGDLLYVYFNPTEVAEKGDILVYYAPETKELTAHRLVLDSEEKITKGDAALSLDASLNCQTMGKVIGFKRHGEKHFWGTEGQALKGMLSQLSLKKSGRNSRLVNYFYKLLIICVTKISLLIEKGSSSNYTPSTFAKNL